MKAGAIIGIILVVIILAGAVWYFNNRPNTPSEETQEQIPANTISISGFAFSPKTITIKAGTTITWTNQDSVGHTVTSDSGTELNSELLSKGKSYSHTFNTAGTYSYYCKPHPSMKGTVIVQ